MMLGWLLTIFYICFAALSWILLLRDQWAISVIGQFYPAVAPTLLSWRLSLLHLGLNTLMTVIFALLAVGSLVCYFLALRQPISFKKATLFAAIFLVVTFFSYPILSTDVFDYILSDRVAVVYGRNVWTTPPSAVVPAQSPFYSLASWKTLVNPYGPVNQFFYTLAGQLSGNDLFFSLFVHKLLVLVFALGTLAISALILKKHFPDSLSRGVILLFWNPLFILETAGSAHNDILMIFFLLTSIYFWLGRKYFLTGLFLAISLQVKFVPLFLFPFLLLRLKNEGFAALARFLTGFLLVNLLAFLYLGPAVTPFVERIAIGSSIYWQSLPKLVHPFIPWEKNLFLGGFLFLLASQLYFVLMKKNPPLPAFILTMFFYLLLFTSVYWNWYILWILPLLPFIPWDRLSSAIVLFSASSLLAYPLYWLSLRVSHENPWWQVIIYLFLVLPSLGYYFYAKANSKTQT